jgi:hypothetical protein
MMLVLPFDSSGFTFFITVFHNDSRGSRSKSTSTSSSSSNFVSVTADLGSDEATGAADAATELDAGVVVIGAAEADMTDGARDEATN